MGYIVGIDGCKDAWISVSLDTNSRQLVWNKYYHISDILEQNKIANIFGIDIPIGLTKEGPRTCDIEARKLLGKRRSSVFPAPILAVLGAKDYKNACDIRYGIEGKKVSQQAWAIIPKVAEVDRLIQQRPDFGRLLYEVHPEVSFYFMGNNRPNNYSKKEKLGIDERIEKLSRFFVINHDYINAVKREYRTSKDDIVDALAAAWTAERILYKKHFVLGEVGGAERSRIYV